ncbi:hypothetical protein Tsubulata_048923 [Turnera subulata]|uniref:DRBM domain-containing protein n=1 Tax=Turnera subulata TaxID=218843 RepID=A0A9Q0JQ19_9ROSI|nr:hypothetical protein Tsubulata_048923 [Turnera subulata]
MDALCPSEDAISALLDLLVEPTLPSTPSTKFDPSRYDQEAIAKQVHAVVLLYNHYHRRRHPTLEFMVFEDFIKLAGILKPSLQSLFSLLRCSNSNHAEAEAETPALSLTEQKIMDACEVAKSLDDPGLSSSVEGWPVSKIAVLLVDSELENCFLQFGSITEGVWSLIEKDIDIPTNNAGSDTCKKRKYTRSSNGFQKLAFSAVKDATGIAQGSLEVLETHVTYCLTKLKTAARFYIIQCTQPDNHDVIKMPLLDAVQSLKGPLFTKSSNWWSTTSVVEYFHLLPYAETLLDWLSRKGLLKNVIAEEMEMDAINTISHKSKEVPPEPEVPKQFDKPHLSEVVTDQSDRNSFDSPRQNNNSKCCIGGTEVDDSFTVHFQDKNKKKDACAQAKPEINREITKPEGGCLKGPTNGAKLQADADGFATRQIDPALSGENVSNGDKACNNGSSSDDENGETPVVALKSNRKLFDKLSTIISSKDKELSQAALTLILRRRDKLSLQQREIEEQIAQCDKHIHTILNGGEDDLALKLESVLECCNDISSSGYFQRGIQYQEGQSLLQSCKKRKWTDPCEELDGICYEKNWILPTYHLYARDGEFEATVHVKGTDFDLEWSSKGDLRLKPREAKESAAAHMLVKLQDQVLKK